MDTRIEAICFELELKQIASGILRSQVNPENCIDYRLTPALVDKDLLFRELRFGQALGLLVLLCFTHYCAST